MCTEEIVEQAPPWRSNELPRSLLRGIKPPLAYTRVPPVWRGGYSCGMRTLEQPQLDVLAMQLRIAFFTALLSYITQVATY
jgi:hypothetical protein